MPADIQVEVSIKRCDRGAKPREVVCYTLVDVQVQAPMKGYEQGTKQQDGSTRYAGGHLRTGTGEGLQARD